VDATQTNKNIENFCIGRAEEMSISASASFIGGLPIDLALYPG
jgi:hypothetical protein